jgi:hypothetical protein
MIYRLSRWLYAEKKAAAVKSTRAHPLDFPQAGYSLCQARGSAGLRHQDRHVLSMVFAQALDPDQMSLGTKSPRIASMHSNTCRKLLMRYFALTAESLAAAGDERNKEE